MRHQFSIFGSSDDPVGNPQPYYRTTQRSKWSDPGAMRYADWQEHVRATFLKECGDWCDTKKPIDLGKRNGWMKLIVYFKDDKHGDPDNIFKGIADALFINDKNLYGTIIPGGKRKEGGLVEVTITFLE